MSATEHSARAVFGTPRLEVYDWHAAPGPGTQPHRLASVVRALLTPAVTADLPPSWQGPFDDAAARAWIEDRDAEGRPLLVLAEEDRRAIGLVMLHDVDPAEPGREVRLGYLLAESEWGRGLATELVRGLAAWAAGVGIGSIVAGVTASNVGSIRVLEKAGFERMLDTEKGGERFYRWAPTSTGAKDE